MGGNLGLDGPENLVRDGDKGAIGVGVARGRREEGAEYGCAGRRRAAMSVSSTTLPRERTESVRQTFETTPRSW
jgi:hypothetical protein